MYAISEAFTAAASLLGFGAVRGGASADSPETRPARASVPAPVPAPDAMRRPADPLAAGAPCFEAVAAALREAGLLV